ncbi:MAG TPA: response regulator transcription factor [Thermoleophilaceae bacterium]|jgi:DNA-binding NarL/FixJ family response regulator|nr:response regulator transcription factor [Thermoleophilaceae bacterium]
MAIRVLIADDEAMVRGGFRMILESEDGIEVVAEADDGALAISQALRFMPDVVVMDIQMPVVSGIEATRTIIERGTPPPRVLVVTTFDVDDYVYEALRAGAGGFLLKNAPPEELIRAIRVLAAGDSLLSPSVTRKVIEEFARKPGRSAPPPAALDELTEREAEVLLLMARGMSNAEIAARLVLSQGTVKTHVARILMKLGLRDRIQAVVLAYETGLIEPGQVFES